jgi:hypothetical protein
MKNFRSNPLKNPKGLYSLDFDYDNGDDGKEETMSDYIEELDDVIASVVEVVKEIEDGMELANIGTVIKKTKKKSIKNSDTLLRDAIMVAVGKGKLKIRKNPPNQLLLELPATGRIENGGREGYNG